MPDLVSYFEAALTEQGAEFSAEIQGVQSALTDTKQTVAELQDTVEALELPTEVVGRINSLQTTTYAAIGVAVIAILIAAYAILAKK